jgi:hypothetical protein
VCRSFPFFAPHIPCARNSTREWISEPKFTLYLMAQAFFDKADYSRRCIGEIFVAKAQLVSAIELAATIAGSQPTRPTLAARADVRVRPCAVRDRSLRPSDDFLQSFRLDEHKRSSRARNRAIAPLRSSVFSNFVTVSRYEPTRAASSSWLGGGDTTEAVRRAASEPDNFGAFSLAHVRACSLRRSLRARIEAAREVTPQRSQATRQ